MSWVGERSRSWLSRWQASRAAAVAYVSERTVRLAVGGVVTHAATVDGRESALASLAAGMRELPRRARVRVAVSGAICRPFVLPHVDGAAGEGDWTAIAASMVEDATGLPSDSQVWLDDGQTSPRLAVAIDATWLRGLEAIGARIDSVRPWWALAIDAVATTPADREQGVRGLVVTDGDTLVLLIAEGEIYCVAQTYALEDESAETVLSRVLVTHDLSTSDLVWMRVDEHALPGHVLNARLAFGEEVSV